MNMFSERVHSNPETDTVMDQSAPSQPGTRRQQQKARTRELILNTARTHFETLGFEGTTMRAVAADAGIAAGTIFTHFADKGALLLAALLEDLAATDRRILDTLRTDDPIRDQILHVAAAGYGYWCSRPALSAVLLREMYFIGGSWADTRHEETARFIEFGRGLLEAARQRGELRSNADCGSIIEALYTFYVGRLIRAAGHDRFDLDELLADTATFIDDMLSGIARPQS